MQRVVIIDSHKAKKNWYTNKTFTFRGKRLLDFFFKSMKKVIGMDPWQYKRWCHLCTRPRKMSIAQREITFCLFWPRNIIIYIIFIDRMSPLRTACLHRCSGWIIVGSPWVWRKVWCQEFTSSAFTSFEQLYDMWNDLCKVSEKLGPKLSSF